MADLYVPSQGPKAIVEVVGRGLVHNDGSPCTEAEIQATLFLEPEESANTSSPVEDQASLWADTPEEDD